MRYPVVDEEGDSWVGEEVEGFSRGGVRCHYYQRRGVEGCGGEVGVVHEGDVRG